MAGMLRGRGRTAPRVPNQIEGSAYRAVPPSFQHAREETRVRRNVERTEAMSRRCDAAYRSRQRAHGVSCDKEACSVDEEARTSPTSASLFAPSVSPQRRGVNVTREVVRYASREVTKRDGPQRMVTIKQYEVTIYASQCEWARSYRETDRSRSHMPGEGQHNKIWQEEAARRGVHEARKRPPLAYEDDNECQR